MARTPQPLDPSREGDLVVTAARYFASTGYTGTSLNKVVAEADWAKSSFYHYFSSKRRLHDHVVRTLAARLLDGVEVPDVEDLSAAQFWGVLSDLADAIERAAAQHPETRYLGEMFHRPTAANDGMLQDLREQVEQWLRRSIIHGREVGAVREDLPEDLVIELALALVRTLDRWAIHHELNPTGGPAACNPSIQLVRELIEHPQPTTQRT